MSSYNGSDNASEASIGNDKLVNSATRKRRNNKLNDQFIQ